MEKLPPLKIGLNPEWVNCPTERFYSGSAMFKMQMHQVRHPSNQAIILMTEDTCLRYLEKHQDPEKNIQHVPNKTKKRILEHYRNLVKQRILPKLFAAATTKQTT